MAIQSAPPSDPSDLNPVAKFGTMATQSAPPSEPCVLNPEVNRAVKDNRTNLNQKSEIKTSPAQCLVPSDESKAEISADQNAKIPQPNSAVNQEEVKEFRAVKDNRPNLNQKSEIKPSPAQCLVPSDEPKVEIFVDQIANIPQPNSAGNQEGETSGSGTLEVRDLPEEVIFLQILPKLKSKDIFPMIMVSRSWASFILHDGPGLMLFNQPGNPIPNSILIEINPISDYILVRLSPETRQICTETRFLIVPVINSYVKPRFPLFTVPPKFIEKGEIASVVGSCSGIICLQIASASTFVLVNPLTKFFKEVRAPQNDLPHFEVSTKPNAAGFFCDESSEDMKIVQFLTWDPQDHSLDLPRAQTIHALRIYSVKSGQWLSVGLEEIKTPPGYICGLYQTLPKPLATFVDPYHIVSESSFLIDLHDFSLMPVPVVGGVELSSACVCWLDKVGVRATDNSIYVLNEQCETWNHYATLPDELRRDCIFFCLDGGNIVVAKDGHYDIFNSATGEVHHIPSLPDCRFFPYVPTLFCVEGMNRF